MGNDTLAAYRDIFERLHQKKSQFWPPIPSVGNNYKRISISINLEFWAEVANRQCHKFEIDYNRGNILSNLAKSITGTRVLYIDEDLFARFPLSTIKKTVSIGWKCRNHFDSVPNDSNSDVNCSIIALSWNYYLYNITYIHVPIKGTSELQIENFVSKGRKTS